jgi:tetratricopeptide (TPR) repeat protein
MEEPTFPAPTFQVQSAPEAHKLSFDLLNQGTAAYKSGDYLLAIDRLKIASAIGMASFDAHYYLGLALYSARRYHDAIEPLQTALDLQPSHLQAHVALGDTYLRLGDQENAQAEYALALKVKEDFAPAIDGLGRLAEAQGKNTEAEEQYKRAIAANRGYPDPLLHLGDLAARAGDLEESVTYLTRALSLRPDLAEGLNRLGLVDARLGLYDEAIAAIGKAIANPTHLVSLGKAQLLFVRPTAAAESFRKALVLDPDYFEAYSGLAEAQSKLGDYPGALKAIDDALSREIIDRETKILYQQKRATIARERDETAALRGRVDTGDADNVVLARLAALEIGAGRYEAALPWQESLAAKDPSGPVLRRLAFLYLQLGRYREALPLYEKALAAGSGDAASWVNLGLARAALGDDPGAIEAYRRALEIDPKLLEANLNLGIALFRTGDENGSRDALARYLASAPKGESSERVRRFLTSIGWKPPQPAPSGGAPIPVGSGSEGGS